MKLISIILLLTFPLLSHAQVEGSCWEVKSDLKKIRRYVCSAVNPSPFSIAYSQHHIFQQLSAVRPLPHALVLERGADQNRKHGNSRLERFEKRGLPLMSVLGAAGVIGSGVVTAGVSAALPMVVPGIRGWFMEASPPLWTASEQLLSDREIVMEPGSAIGFWFYAEKGDMQGEFRILPMEMEVVESALSTQKASNSYYLGGWGFSPFESYTGMGSNLLTEDPTVETTHEVRRISTREPVFQPMPVDPPTSPAPAPRQVFYIRTVQ